MSEHLRKPDWLKIRLGGNEQFTRTKSIVESHCLHTICTSGKCPNMGECWSRGTATFMIAGDICTRSCRFCNTLTGKPLPLDPKEPANVAESIRLMNLKHAVITSVDRDDLPDLGATVEEVCELMDDVRAAGVSVLTIGQYLQPSRKNIPVKEYVTPEQFESYKSIALQKGFKKVESAPLVRSSYHAEKHV